MRQIKSSEAIDFRAAATFLSADPDPGFTPELVPGFGFHLEGDGFWDVQEIPKDVISKAKFSGYLEIEGFDSAVFDMPDGDQWAQKEPGLPAPKGDEAIRDILSFDIHSAARHVSKLNLDPGIQRSLQSMVENMAAAETALDQAVQHGRRLQMEPSFDWILQQVQSTLEEFSEFRKSAVDAIDYAL